VGANPVTCPTPDQCHAAGTCNPATGVCSTPNAPDGTSCTDNNACTPGDMCQNGSCQAGTLKVCTAQDQCHTAGTCDLATGVCSNPAKPDGTVCNDNKTCTDSDVCTGGQCAGSDVDLTLVVIKTVVNDDGSGLAAKDFQLALSVNSGTPTTFPGAAGPAGTTFTLHNGDSYTVTEDLMQQPVGDLRQFYQVSYSADCTGSLVCDPTAGRHKTCTVTNNDIRQQNQPNVSVIQYQWTYTPSPVGRGTGTVASIAGSFQIKSNNQATNVLAVNMSVLLEQINKQGNPKVVADPATCTFTPAAPFIFTTAQGVTFSCDVSSLGFKANDVVNATVRVTLFNGTTVTSAVKQTFK
jgi:hypothetical protein